MASVQLFDTLARFHTAIWIRLWARCGQIWSLVPVRARMNRILPGGMYVLVLHLGWA